MDVPRDMRKRPGKKKKRKKPHDQQNFYVVSTWTNIVKNFQPSAISFKKNIHIFVKDIINLQDLHQ